MRSPRPVASLPEAASPGAERCSVLAALTVVGDFWTLGVLRTVFNGRSRFSEIAEDLGVATNVLTDRLGRLVDAGLLERVPYGPTGVRHRYALTAAGLELGPVLLALKAWGDRHAQPDGPPTAWRHAGCPTPVRLEVRCPDCDEALALGDMELAPVR